MTFFIIVLIIILLPLLFPYITRWIRSYIMGKMEDRMRRMMGMPTRAEEKKARKAQEREQRKERRSGWGRDNDAAAGRGTESNNGGGSRYGFRRHGRNHNVGNPVESLRQMRIYAEDVEFVEIREYSAELHFEQDEQTSARKLILEEQMSDAEYVVIRI